MRLLIYAAFLNKISRLGLQSLSDINPVLCFEHVNSPPSEMSYLYLDRELFARRTENISQSPLTALNTICRVKNATGVILHVRYHFSFLMFAINLAMHLPSLVIAKPLFIITLSIILIIRHANIAYCLLA